MIHEALTVLLQAAVVTIALAFLGAILRGRSK